ncbi:hypothetical protein MACK_002162 [Theileria orientalis]|uniref:Prokaryotic-type class I peptide chain release factors domain-containing protein n=1 Tax=Theileria orientalis TaxID=68886 RepID=A0A976MB83_THEOR|nr:hypothetical protein MACK_002162 [Theileria orientalis]
MLKLQHRNFTTNKTDLYHKQFSKLEKSLENVHLNTLLPLKDVVSLYSGDYDEGLYKLFKSELLALYYDSYLQILKLSDSKFKGLKSRLVETQSSMFSGEFHKISECDKVILQVKAGVGGEESARFASELFNMYTNICKDRGFRMVKHIDNAAEITGGTDFFKYEFGVHRVQRVPFNCKRIQTSSAVVTVVPHFALETTKLKSSDLHVETMRSSGSGGQSVNKSETAVRVTHIPSGISVSIRDTSSQIDNKSIAMDLILKKLREKQESELEMVKSEVKSTQFRTGDRSEKIRTFNFMHDTITDHRCKLTLNGVDSFLEFGEGIDDIHQRLLSMEDSLIVNFMMENIDMIVEYYGIASKLK